MARKTLMGSILRKVAAVRWQVKRDAAEALWKRNGLDNPARRSHYRMIEDTTINDKGEEVTTIKLWQLVDKEVVILGASIS